MKFLKLVNVLRYHELLLLVVVLVFPRIIMIEGVVGVGVGMGVVQNEEKEEIIIIEVEVEVEGEEDQVVVERKKKKATHHARNKKQHSLIQSNHLHLQRRNAEQQRGGCTFLMNTNMNAHTVI